jgi:hypothetical protein
VPALGPGQLAARLEDHPGLLAGGAARPGRHRSLEALVSWSYDLLGEAERRLLGRLSVLRGGFDLEVAERVCGGEPLAPPAVAGLLADLAGKSLVQVQAGPVVRYSLLETVRQFAAGRLAASGEDTAVHACLLRWALGVGRSAEAALQGAEWPRWSDQLSADQANIRAALSWALGGAEPEAGRELAARLARWWIATGRYSEAGQFLTAAADACPPPVKTTRRARSHRQFLPAERHTLRGHPARATMARPIRPDEHEMLSDFAGALHPQAHPWHCRAYRLYVILCSSAGCRVRASRGAAGPGGLRPVTALIAPGLGWRSGRCLAGGSRDGPPAAGQVAAQDPRHAVRAEQPFGALRPGDPHQRCR